MRVALVTNLYPPIQTGTAHWTRELAHHLCRAGHSVTVIACAAGAKSPLDEPAHDGPVTVYRLPSRRLRASQLLLGFDEFYIANTAANRRRMREILQRHEIELAHQCGHLLDLTYATPIVAKQVGIPCVCSIHTVIHSPTSRVADLLMKAVDRTLVRHFGPERYDTLIGLDAEVRSYIERTYRHRRTRTVLVSIDDDVLQRPAIQTEDESPFRILSVGHVTAMRSRVDLVKAVELLHRRGVPIELVIVGKLCDGAAQQLVRDRALGGFVTFTGELPRGEIFARARTCHMEAHWITVPGLGTATLEAMALGLPVMAWAFPGLYEDVPLRDGIELIFAQPGNVKQIAAQIQRVIDQPDLRRAIAAAGRALVRQHLSWPIAIARVERIYQEALGGVVEGTALAQV
jgi:glycosyltransferase involved in cell wall biosynthesis